MERLSANWKWILTTALPIVFAILVFLPARPRVRPVSEISVDDYVVPVSYDLSDESKPSPFPVVKVKHYRAAPVAPPPDPEQ